MFKKEAGEGEGEADPALSCHAGSIRRVRVSLVNTTPNRLFPHCILLNAHIDISLEEKVVSEIRLAQII